MANDKCQMHQKYMKPKRKEKSLITKTRKGENTKQKQEIMKEMIDNFDFKEVEFEAFEKERQAQRFEDLSRKVIGAAINVHSSLGPGFLESIYEEAMKLELNEYGLPFECQKEISVEYLGVLIGRHRLDLVVDNQIIVELKAVKDMNDVHFAQLRSYLKATGLKVGLLLNFAKPKLEIRRVVN